MDLSGPACIQSHLRIILRSEGDTVYREREKDGHADKSDIL